MLDEYDLIPIQTSLNSKLGTVVPVRSIPGSGKVISVYTGTTQFNVIDGENVMLHLTPVIFPGFDNSKANRTPFDVDFCKGINVKNYQGEFIGQLESIDYNKMIGIVLGTCVMWYDDYVMHRRYPAPIEVDVSELFFSDPIIDNYVYR